MYFKANYHRRGLIEKSLLFMTSNPVYRKISHRTNRKQIFLAMKMTTILLFFACLTASAGGIAQKVTLSQKNVKLEKVFREIRKQTGYVFFYDASVLQETSPVNIHVKDASVEKALEETLQGQPLDFSIERKTITIIRKTVTTKPIVDILPAVPLNIITGTVKDEKGNLLAGVSVIIKGTTKGTSTAIDGSFSVDANVGDVLEFSIVGYKKKSVTVGQDNSIIVVMEIEAAVGSEVVVVGYGTQKKVNLTGSVVSISAKDIKDRANTDLLTSIQGQVPGVTIISRPGETPSINFRGRGNLGTSAPLFVINGVIADQTILNFSGGTDKIRYSTGVDYLYDDQFMPGQSNKRYNLHSRLSSDVTDWLTINTDISYIRTKFDQTNGATSNSRMQYEPSIMVGQQSNGEWGSIAGGAPASQTYINYNPLRALSTNNWAHNNTANTIFNLGFDLKPVKGLIISGQGSYSGIENKSKSYTALQDNVKNFATGNEIPGTGNTTNEMDMSWGSTTR